METGKLAILSGKRNIDVKNFPVPDVEDDGLLIKVEAASICGTDGHFFNSTPLFPSCLGHEFTGEIVKIGKSANKTIHVFEGPIKLGDRIAVYPWITCGVCNICVKYGPGICGICDNGFLYGAPLETRSNNMNINTNAEEYPHFKGGFGEYVYIFPGTFVWKIPEEMPSIIATLLDPTAVAVRAIEMAQTEAGVLCESLNTNSKVVIIGAGPIGILTALVLRILGVEKIIITGHRGFRLEKAKQIAYVDETIDVNDNSIEERVAKIRDITNGGADLVIQCSNHVSGTIEGLQVARKLGTFIEVGTSFLSYEVKVDLPKLIFSKNLRVLGMVANSPKAFDKAFHLLKRYKKYSFEKLFTHKIKKMKDPDYIKGVLIFKK